MNQPPRPGDGPGPNQPSVGPGPYRPSPGRPVGTAGDQPGPTGWPGRAGYPAGPPPHGPGGASGPRPYPDTGEHAGPSFQPPHASFGPYGAPPGGQPPLGGPPQQPSGGNNRALLITLTVVLALVLLAGSGLGGWYLFGRTDDSKQAHQGNGGDNRGPSTTADQDNTKPPDTDLTGQVVWEHNWPKSNALNTATVGSWTLDDVVVVGRPDELAAYDLDDGKQVWKTALPRDKYICGMSRNTARGTGAVTLSEAGELRGKKQALCGEVMLVDTTNGEPRSTAPVPDTPFFESPMMEMTESGVVFGDYRLFRLPLDGGRVTRIDDRPGGCRTTSVRASEDGTLAAINSCGYGSNEKVTVSSLSPDDGRQQWTSEPIQLRSDEFRLTFASIDPIVVRTTGSARAGRLFNLDDDGKLMSEIRARQDFGSLSFEGSQSGARTSRVRHPAVEANSMDVSAERGMLATDDVVYLTVASSGGTDSATIVAAFDRRNGALRWKQAVIGESELIFAGVDKSGVVMLSKGTKPNSYTEDGGKAPRVYHLGAQKGDQKPLGKPYADLMPPASFSFDWMNVHATWTGKAVVVVDLGHDEGDKDPRFVYALR